MKKSVLLFFLFYVLTFLGISQKTMAQNVSQEGIASYYHDMFEGRKTASGEIFDQSKWTAAHKNLPFDTWLKIRDEKGKEVVVRINDRLPSHSSRVIDLTKTTASDLGMIIDGLRKVTITTISPQEAWRWFQDKIFLLPIYTHMLF